MDLLVFRVSQSQRPRTFRRCFRLWLCRLVAAALLLRVISHMVMDADLRRREQIPVSLEPDFNRLLKNQSSFPANLSLNTFDQELDKNSKVILIWSSFVRYKRSDWNKIFSRQIHGQCPYNCRIIYDKQQWRSADAIMFKQVNNIRLPSKHLQNQVWVLFSAEAPTHKTWVISKKKRKIFDWLMNYHTLADVVTPFGWVTLRDQHIKNSTAIKTKDYWAEKKDDRFASWMVSKCTTPSRREDFVREFMKYENVDIYGGCGNLKCGEHVILPNVGTERIKEECYELMGSYMFYFAFENSLCEDYITEKFFTALRMDSIPVVFGGGDYRSVAPQNSYISAMDFKTPQALAKYLRTVADNRTLYNSYFQWKKEYKVELGFPFAPLVCDLCTKLHHGVMQFSKGRNAAKRTTTGQYLDISGWFTHISKCRSWKPSLQSFDPQ